MDTNSTSKKHVSADKCSAVTRTKPPKSDVQRATRAYQRDNVEAARLAKSDPEQYAALQKWADMVLENAEK
jgi:hypothetical protein